MALENLAKVKNKTLLITGIIFIIFSMAIPVSIFTPVLKSELNYQLNQYKNEPRAEITPKDLDFGIVIPKIGANVKVVENVDSRDPNNYQIALTKGVAHAKGTVTPDKSGNVFIFAHSAGNWYYANQYNAVFYLLNKLEKGDEIFLYYQNIKYQYQVDELKIVGADEVDYLKSNPSQKQLTLMTCWPPGTTLKRQLVIANQK